MIEMMKFDMGGAGAVLGAAQALAGIKPEGVEVRMCHAHSLADLSGDLACQEQLVACLLLVGAV